jgi:hypothetical protein
MNNLKKSDIQHEITPDGYLLLSVWVAGVKFKHRYLYYPLSEAKKHFWDTLKSNPKSLHN